MNTKRGKDLYMEHLFSKLDDPMQWESLENYAVSYIKDRWTWGPVGWFTDVAIEKIYLRLCFREGGLPNLRYTALRALYECWLKQEETAPETVPAH